MSNHKKKRKKKETLIKRRLSRLVAFFFFFFSRSEQALESIQPCFSVFVVRICSCHLFRFVFSLIVWPGILCLFVALLLFSIKCSLCFSLSLNKLRATFSRYFLCLASVFFNQTSPKAKSY